MLVLVSTTRYSRTSTTTVLPYYDEYYDCYEYDYRYFSVLSDLWTYQVRYDHRHTHIYIRIHHT